MGDNFSKSQLFKNIYFTVFQIIISGIILFALYKFIIIKLGVINLGIWSVVSTTITSLAILNYGFSGSLVKYISMNINDNKKINSLIITTFLSVLFFSTILSLFGYFVFEYLLIYLIEESHNLSSALKILPICLLTFWITILSSTFTAALEGLNFIHKKNILSVFSNVIVLVVALFLIPKFGLSGLAFSYLFSSIFLLVSSFIVLFTSIENFKFKDIKWDKAIYLETKSYNQNYQIISIFAVFNDPILKYFIVKFCGLEISGIFEIVNKLVLQVRGIIVNVNQALVPMFSNYSIGNENGISKLYSDSFKYVFLISVTFFSGIYALSPLFSYWWFGELNITFFYILILFNTCYLINTISAPAYFANLGSGNLKWNRVTQIILSLLNIFLSFIIIAFLPSQYLFFAWFISIIFTSILLIQKYHKETNHSIEKILTKSDISIAFQLLLSSIICSILLCYTIKQANIIYITLILTIYLSFYLLLIFKYFKKNILLKIQK